MKLGENITQYRKKKNLTQSALAQMLGVSFQAVSKWENGHSMPDIQLLPKIAEALNVSCDVLIGHYTTVVSSPYEELYQSKEYYWGIQPTDLSMKVLSFCPQRRYSSILDIGCREGQNVLFFARNGYRTTGIDRAETGIKKAQQLAETYHVQAQLICVSLEDYVLSESFDIVFCDNMLHLVPEDCRGRILSECKKLTPSGGVHVIRVPVEKPFLEKGPSLQQVYPWRSGELFSLYWDWEILEGEETKALVGEYNGGLEIYNYVVARKPMEKE